MNLKDMKLGQTVAYMKPMKRKKAPKKVLDDVKKIKKELDKMEKKLEKKYSDMSGRAAHKMKMREMKPLRDKLWDYWDKYEGIDTGDH